MGSKVGARIAAALSSTAVRHAAAAESFVIEGGRPLSGHVRAAGNKNGALPILAGCLLTDEPVTLTNVPRIRDVETMLELLSDLGADVDWIGDNDVHVHAADIRTHEPNGALSSRIRASFLLAGPLLARVGRAGIAPPGGDVIGRRRLDPHIHAFAELGAVVDVGERYEFRGDGLRGADIHLDEASVMATENAVMAATLTPGRTTISNAACEPHVQDLCRFLVRLGARIDGIGSNVLHVSGVERLFGGEHRIAPEHIEVASFIGLAAVTGGELTIDDASSDDLMPILPAFEKLGVRVELAGESVRVPAGQELVIQDDLGGAIPSRSSIGRIATRSSGRTSSIVISPGVIAPRPMKLATSMWSGPSVNSPPDSRSTPSMRSTFEPTPWMRAPRPDRKRQRSWMCGSQAALPITVSPRAKTAAMIVFSVPVTLASSRNRWAPTRVSASMV